MGSIDTPRLYRKKRCGTYFLRVILGQSASSSEVGGRKRNEVRCSLRTKDPGRARALAAWANARLELARTMTDRHDLWRFIGADIRQWTADKNGFAADGPDDTRNLNEFLEKNPKIVDAFAQGMQAAPPEKTPRELELMALIAKFDTREPVRAAAHPSQPPNPMPMSRAFAEYRRGKLVDAAHKARTADDKERLFNKFVAHVVATNPELGTDPCVHDIGTHHLTAFLNGQGSGSAAPSGSTNLGRPKRAATPAPATLQKQLSDLCSFFDFAHGQLKATLVNPGDGLAGRRKDLKAAVSRKRKHYKPYTNEQLAKVFEPRTYLAFNRHADFFWVPLLALHLGARLGELVNLSLKDVRQQPSSGIWWIEITDDNAKNKNSVRKVPISQALVRLGFISYVRHLHRIGATHLFPHRDMTTKTALRLPSKNCSRQFGKYLESIGLKDADADLVFHSFRHSVIQALQDNHTPTGDSMQLVGHAAQEHALQSGQLTAQAARSVHLSVYGHAGQARLNVANPLARLKSHFDLCPALPLDYTRLRRAAYLVARHTVKSNGTFSCGWSILHKTHTQTLNRLK